MESHTITKRLLQIYVSVTSRSGSRSIIIRLVVVVVIVLVIGGKKSLPGYAGHQVDENEAMNLNVILVEGNEWYLPTEGAIVYWQKVNLHPLRPVAFGLGHLKKAKVDPAGAVQRETRHHSQR